MDLSIIGRCSYYIIYIKNFAWEDQRQKRCYIFHIVPQGVNVLYCNNIEPDTRVAKNRKDFRWLSLADTVMDKIANVTTQ